MEHKIQQRKDSRPDESRKGKDDEKSVTHRQTSLMVTRNVGHTLEERILCTAPDRVSTDVSCHVRCASTSQPTQVQRRDCHREIDDKKWIEVNQSVPLARGEQKNSDTKRQNNAY